jgi:hypothetical protein
LCKLSQEEYGGSIVLPEEQQRRNRNFEGGQKDLAMMKRRLEGKKFRLEARASQRLAATTS